MKKRKKRLRSPAEAVVTALVTPLIALCLAVVLLCCYLSIRIELFFTTRRLYRFFVDTRYEKKTLDEVFAVVPEPRDMVLAALGDLICFGYVEANVREYLLAEDEKSPNPAPLFLGSRHVAPHLDLKRRGCEYPLVEFSWSGKLMRVQVPSKRRARALLQHLRVGWLHKKPDF